MFNDQIMEALLSLGGWAHVDYLTDRFGRIGTLLGLEILSMTGDVYQDDTGYVYAIVADSEIAA